MGNVKQELQRMAAIATKVDQGLVPAMCDVGCYLAILFVEGCPCQVRLPRFHKITGRTLI